MPAVYIEVLCTTCGDRLSGKTKVDGRMISVEACSRCLEVATLAGQDAGRREGIEAGRRDGDNAGFLRGYDAGYDDGSADGWDMRTRSDVLIADALKEGDVLAPDDPPYKQRWAEGL